MASYLGESDLAADLAAFRPSLSLTTTSEPTLAQAQTQRNELEGVVNGALARAGLTVPVTLAASPYSYYTIRQAMKAGMAAWCYRARGYTPESGDMTADVIVLEQEWRAFIAALDGGIDYLSDAVSTSGSGPERPYRVTVKSLWTEGTTDGEDAVDRRAFSRGQKL